MDKSKLAKMEISWESPSITVSLLTLLDALVISPIIASFNSIAHPRQELSLLLGSTFVMITLWVWEEAMSSMPAEALTSPTSMTQQSTRTTATPYTCCLTNRRPNRIVFGTIVVEDELLKVVGLEEIEHAPKCAYDELSCEGRTV